MDPTKFYQRTRLFKDIIYEIIDVESNYRTQLNMLNLKIIRLIEEHNNVVYIRKLGKRQTVVNRKTIKIPERNVNLNRTLKTSKSNDNILSDKEDNPMIDKLMSEGLQHLLSFYRTKHNLISKEVSNLGIIMYNFSTYQKKFDSDEDLNILEKYKEEFDTNFTKLMKVKKKYFDEMNSLELFLHEEENKKIIMRDPKKRNEIIQNKINENNNNNNNEKEKTDELLHLRQKYKKKLIELNKNQKAYISKLNEIGKDIQQFNINENNILHGIFKAFEENLICLLKEINNYCIVYEHNKKLIKDLNIELVNTFFYDKRIYASYNFEEYIPKNTDISNHKDFSVIQKMNKLIGFEFNKIKTNKINNIEENEDENKLIDNISYNNIDDNLLFILLMDKFSGGEYLLNEKEKQLMKNLFNQEKYLYQFLSKLNKIRINRHLFSNRDHFFVLLEFFNEIYAKVSLMDDKSHELVKFMMILSETFNYKEGDRKIFLNNVIKKPKELKDPKFWINYIELEIKLESKNYENKKNSRYEYIVLLSNTTHLKEYLIEKEIIKQIIQYFREKYKFTLEELDIIKGQLHI